MERKKKKSAVWILFGNLVSPQSWSHSLQFCLHVAPSVTGAYWFPAFNTNPYEMTRNKSRAKKRTINQTKNNNGQERRSSSDEKK